MVEDNVNSVIRMFTREIRNEVRNNRIINNIRIIVRIIKETSDTSIDRVRINKKGQEECKKFEKEIEISSKV